eukprot:m.640841 g.640841  ORF g.640841 m.640841 type:complete len:174 (+) comp22624_c0_seq7:1652-2173(+)
MGQAGTVRLALWDIAGQERFGGMTRVYFKNASAAFVVVDVSQPNGLSAAKVWKAELDSKVALPNGDGIPVVLLANKCDLARQVETTELQAFCSAAGFKAWVHTSAKNNTNIEEAMQLVVTQIDRSRVDSGAPGISAGGGSMEAEAGGETDTGDGTSKPKGFVVTWQKKVDECC